MNIEEKIEDYLERHLSDKEDDLEEERLRITGTGRKKLEDVIKNKKNLKNSLKKSIESETDPKSKKSKQEHYNELVKTITELEAKLKSRITKTLT